MVRICRRDDEEGGEEQGGQMLGAFALRGGGSDVKQLPSVRPEFFRLHSA